VTLLPTVRAPEVAQARSALAAGGGLITLTADMAQEAISVRKLAVAGLDDSWAIAEVDIGRCVSTRDLAIQLARAVCSTYLADPALLEVADEQLAPDERAQLVEIANVAGARLLRGARGTVGEHDDLREYQELIGDALDTLTRRAARGEQTLLALDSADELLDPPRTSRARFGGTRELLSLIRGRLQHAIVTPTVIFAGGPATTDLVSRRDASFFGWGTNVGVERPHISRLHAAVASWLEAETDIRDTLVAEETAHAVVEVAERSLPTTERLLGVLSSTDGSTPTISVRRAWGGLLEADADRLRQTARAVSALDRLALAAASAIAEKRPPYAIPEAPHGSEVAKALSALRIAGFAVSPQKGEWRLTDPLFASWLRGRRSGGTPPIGAHDLRNAG
jgi:hypothetical protein